METDIVVEAVEPTFSEERLRTPLKFGTGVITHITMLTVRAQVRNRRGETASGAGCILLSDIWAFPSAVLDHAARDAAMRRLAERACRAYLEAGAHFAHPLAISWDVKNWLPRLAEEVTKELGLVEPVPVLAAQVCASPADAAVHDAFGKLCGVPTYDAYGPRFSEHDLARYLGPRFAGRYLSDFLAPRYRPELPIFHLVGALDKLTENEISESDPQDGLPVSLDQWIRRDGLFCFKVKITGTDIDWDVERTAAVADVAYRTRQSMGSDGTIFLSADSNELHHGPEAVVEYLRKLRERSPLAYGALLYVEQPTERDLEAHSFDMRPVAALKPVLADEGITDVRHVDVARRLGWSGVALKTCKGHAAALLCAAKALAEGMLLSVQDLTNPGLALIHSAGLAARLPTVMGFEYNARQYLPFSQPDIQQAHEPLFRVRGGKVSLRSLSPTGLGYG
ncbi:MAG: hypothetical protein H5T86_09375 [Armatimonadetes bacterium]|nr:hypothetical protein [Armatimonadota bacterium]